MSVPIGAKWVTVTITGSNTSVDVGANTHKLPYTPEVWEIVPVRTSATGNVDPNTTFWWDTTAPNTGDGGNSVRIVCGTAPGGTNNYQLYVLLGPAGPSVR